MTISKRKKEGQSVQDRIIMDNVLRIVKQRGWTIRKLADKMGVAPSIISNIKAGDKGIGKRTLKRFAEALDVAESVLVSKVFEDGTEKDPLDHLIRAIRELPKEERKTIFKVINISSSQEHQKEAKLLKEIINSFSRMIVKD